MVQIKPVFITHFFEQKRTIETLLEESRADGPFYLMLGTSAFITTLGLLLGNTIVVIGGMLVAPLLFPVLALGMGITTSSSQAISRSLGIVWKSIVVVMGISFLTAFILNANSRTEAIKLAADPNLFYFLTAFASGVIAAFTWVKEKMSSSLPGVAVTVALVPPLAVAGIAIAFFSRTLFTGSITLFLVNLLGIVTASAIIFSLFGFSRLQHLQEKEIEEEERHKDDQESILAQNTSTLPTDESNNNDTSK